VIRKVEGMAENNEIKEGRPLSLKMLVANTHPMGYEHSEPIA